MWQFFLILASQLIFFTFVGLCVGKFGLLSCYSAYGPKWKLNVPGNLNIWQAVTIWTALLIVPVIVESGTNSPFQFAGFLAPASLLFVGATPDYQSNKLSFILHQIGAWLAIIFVIVYSIFVPNLWWIILIFIGIAALLSLTKKDTWMFWGEMAIYLSLYIILYVTV